MNGNCHFKRGSQLLVTDDLNVFIQFVVKPIYLFWPFIFDDSTLLKFEFIIYYLLFIIQKRFYYNFKHINKAISKPDTLTEFDCTYN